MEFPFKATTRDFDLFFVNSVAAQKFHMVPF